MSEVKAITVSRIEIKDVLGIHHLEIAPGRVTEIRGRNQEGKTSVIEAIKALLEGGHDATLLRHGAEEGEVVLELSNGVRARKRVTAVKSTLDVLHPDLGEVGRAQKYLSDLAPEISFNPVAFVDAAPKERVRILLEAVSPQVTAAEIAETLGAPPDAFGLQVPEHGPALSVVPEVRRAVYDERTGLNRAAREKRATADQVSSTLPPREHLELDWDQETRAAEAAVKAVNAERLQAREAARSEAARAIEDHDLQTTCGAADLAAEGANRLADLDERVRAIEAALQEARAARAQAAAEGQRSLDHYRAKRAEERAALKLAGEQRGAAAFDARAAAALEAEAHRAGTIERAKHAAAARKQAEYVTGLRRDVEGLEARSERLTAALAALDQLEQRLLADLPIRGLAVQAGEVTLDGVPFPRLSGAQQVELAFAVAARVSGRLRLVLADGLERLDTERFAAFCAAVERLGFQALVTRVSDEALTVRTDGGAR